MPRRRSSAHAESVKARCAHRGGDTCDDDPSPGRPGRAPTNTSSRGSSATSTAVEWTVNAATGAQAGHRLGEAQLRSRPAPGEQRPGRATSAPPPRGAERPLAERASATTMSTSPSAPGQRTRRRRGIGHAASQGRRQPSRKTPTSAAALTDQALVERETSPRTYRWAPTGTSAAIATVPPTACTSGWRARRLRVTVI